MNDSDCKTSSKASWVRPYRGPLFVLFLLLGCYSTWSYVRFDNFADGLSYLCGYKLVPIKDDLFAGDCFSGEELKSTFFLRNLTNKQIEILGYQPDCSCVTSTSQFPIKVSPFSVAELEMGFVARSFSENTKETHKIILHLDTDSHPITLAQTVAVRANESGHKNEEN